jgi:hypothetical protein
MLAAPSENTDDEKDFGNGPLTGSEHLIGYLMRHILDNKLGVLPYKV